MLELSDRIKGHFRNPQNVREFENPEGMGAINNPVRGDTTAGYLEREGKNELSLRAKRLIPEISEYCKRGQEKE